MSTNKYWTGSVTKCDLCNGPIVDAFVDGATFRSGSWATMCCKCHVAEGTGVGTGKGQVYAKQPDGRWLKVAG